MTATLISAAMNKEVELIRSGMDRILNQSVRVKYFKESFKSVGIDLRLLQLYNHNLYNFTSGLIDNSVQFEQEMYTIFKLLHHGNLFKLTYNKLKYVNKNLKDSISRFSTTFSSF